MRLRPPIFCAWRKKVGRCCAWGYSTAPATGDRGILVAKPGQSLSVIPRQQVGILEAASKGASLRSGWQRGASVLVFFVLLAAVHQGGGEDAGVGAHLVLDRLG